MIHLGEGKEHSNDEFSQEELLITFLGIYVSI